MYWIKNRFVLGLLIILLMGGVGLMGYGTLNAYYTYTITQKAVKVEPFIEKIGAVMHALEVEQIRSVGYQEFQTSEKFQNLQEARAKVNQAIEALDLFIYQSDRFRGYTPSLHAISKELLRIRTLVEGLKGERMEVFYYGYYSGLFGIVESMLQSLSIDQDSRLLHHYLALYHDFLKVRENSVLENSTVYGILLAKKPLSKSERVLLEQMMVRDRLPDYGLLRDEEMVVDIMTRLSSEAYQAILAKERHAILQGASSGQYQVSIFEWLGKVEKKMAYFNQVESLLQEGMKRSSIVHIQQLQKRMLIEGGATLLLFVLLLLTMGSYSKVKIRRDRELFEDTLRDIELVFDKTQQKKLKKLIDKGKINHIYKFLIQAIQDANQTKDLFLASMSHEIRTPLNGIVGFTQLLKETEVNAEQAEFITTIEQSSANLLNILNDVLDLAKIKAQKIELEAIAFDPIESFESAVESYAAKSAQEDIDFNIFVDPTLPTQLIGDPTKVSQVIVNLISNAIKFTPKHGEVSVKIEKLSEEAEEVKVKFSVSDTGIGITKEQQKKIFEAFGQADVSTSRKYGGTGLGLSISGKLVTLMGGELRIRSVQDEGSTFYFTATFAKPATATPRVVEDLSHYTVGVLNPNINGEYPINENLERYIQTTGAKIKYYTDASLLALKGSSTVPDILFIDHKFRHRTGELKTFLDVDTKIVILSTGDQKRALKAYSSQIDKILYKPVNFSKTLRALSNKAERVERSEAVKFENVHILVAEDNLINQKLVLNILQKFGIEVTFANNGKEALQKRMSHPYDMLFMDIEMPIMGGMEATGKILHYERSRGVAHVPIIALTANALSGDKVKYTGAGMDGYLAKPIDLKALVEVLERYFEDRIIG